MIRLIIITVLVMPSMTVVHTSQFKSRFSVFLICPWGWGTSRWKYRIYTLLPDQAPIVDSGSSHVVDNEAYQQRGGGILLWLQHYCG